MARPFAPPPPGFVPIGPGTIPHDGDTFRAGGQNARLYGADAFELRQPGFLRTGRTDLGMQAQAALQADLAGGGRARATGAQTWGRPVMTLDTANGDAGLSMIRQGMALPTPNYLQSDPARMTSYIGAQRDAIAAERGAYAGQYQNPAEYRKQGEAAPMRGKLRMTAEQERAYMGLLRDPRTTEEGLNAWLLAQGQRGGNTKQVLDFHHRNPSVPVVPYFDQQDVTGAPVLRDGPGAVTRNLGAFNEGLADVLGAPVDLVNAGMGAVGLPVSDRPFAGSESIRSGLHAIGIGQTDASYAPRSTAEAYAQSASRGLGQAALPFAGMTAAGGRIALSGASALRGGGAVRQATRNLLAETARAPGVAFGAEIGAGVGAGTAGQFARDTFPGNPWADMAAQTLGGLGGGVGAGLAVARARPGYAPPPTARPGEVPPLPVGAALDEVPPPPPGFVPMDQPGIAPAPALSQRQAVARERAVVENKPIGPRGPVHDDLAGDFEAAVARLSDDQDGEVPAALSHPEVGPIDLVWGNRSGGLQHIAEQHPGVIEHLPTIIRGMEVESRSPNRVVLQGADHRSIVRLDYDGERKTWLLTAYERAGKGSAPVSAEYRRADAGGQDGSPDLGAMRNIDPRGGGDNVPPLPPGALLDAVPPPPPGFVPFDPLAGPPRPFDQPTAQSLADIAQGIRPEDVRPIPANTIGSFEEALRANPGTLREVSAPNERDALTPYRLQPNGPSRRDPMDLMSWLRTQGGLRSDRGELAHMGIVDNSPRQMEFARGEGFLGRILNPEGMGLDDAADLAWREGWFPDLAERPTVPEFLDAIRATQDGGSGRVFHPDDYATLDAYRAAQAQRGRVETAAQEGAPLVEDISQPVGLDDLDGNSPPMTAYEDLPALGGRVGNIDVSKLESGEDIGRALATVDERFGGFDAARRGRMAQGETAALASELGMTPETLLKRRRGQALNAEQALAARQILAKSGEDLVQLAAKAAGGTDEQVAAFQKALLRHAAIQEQVSGATAEAGRTLAQFRMTADARAVPKDLFASVINAGGGRKAIEDAAEQLLELQRVTGDPAKVNSFAAKAAKPGFKDKLIELWYNALLSSPKTHVVNTVSNAMTALLQVPEFAGAAALGGARSAVTGSADRVLATEVGQRAFGLLSGVKEGLRAFTYTMRTGVVPDHVSKVESALQEAIPGTLGKVVRVPTRLLAAEDELFKGIARRMELNGLAVRKASMEGLTGRQLRARIAELSSEPTREMMEEASDYARYLTFQRQLGPGLQAVSNATNRSIPVKMVLPFIRTPTNIFSFAIERSPLAPFVRGWRADMAAGGARRDLAIARASMGSGLGLLISSWALNGDITGGRPRDRDAFNMMTADGWQPYSVRVGDKYLSFQRMDPLAMTLGFAADLANGIDRMSQPEAEKAGDELLATLMDQLKDKSFLSGVADVMNALDARNGNLGERSGNYLARQAASLAIPNVFAHVARAVDPVTRDSRDMTGPFVSRIPFASRTMTPRTDPWGRPIINEGGIGPDLLSPMQQRTRQNDPVTAEMLRVGAAIGEPSRTVGGRRLSREEMNAYKAATGTDLRANLTPMIRTPEYRAMEAVQQRKLIEKLVAASRKRARIGMFGGGQPAASTLPPPPPGFVPMLPPPPSFLPVQ